MTDTPDISGTYLDFIPSIAQELPALIAGEETSIDRLMLAAGVCGWITDYEEADWDTWGYGLGDRRTHAIIHETGIDDDGEGFSLAIEWKDNKPIQFMDFSGLTSDDLANVGRAYLNAAIAMRKRETKKEKTNE